MTMPGDVTFNSGDSYFGANLTKAVHDGEVKEARVTDMATRIVAAWYKVGQDKNFPETTIRAFNRTEAIFNNVQSNHKVQAFDMAVKSLVLLKNENILPLSTNTKKIALIGSGALKNQA
jgi:beta-glucosidase